MLNKPLIRRVASAVALASVAFIAFTFLGAIWVAVDVTLTGKLIATALVSFAGSMAVWGWASS